MALHLAWSISLVCFIMSGLEWWSHCHLMHRRKLARLTGSAKLQEFYDFHAKGHHAKYYRDFDHEPDEIGRYFNLQIRIRSGLILSAPFMVLAYFVDPLTLWVILAGAILQPLVWTACHFEMHDPQGRWWSRNPIYRYIRHHHFLHHRHQTKNFGGLLPFFDWLMRTSATPTEKDRAIMREKWGSDSWLRSR